MGLFLFFISCFSHQWQTPLTRRWHSSSAADDCLSRRLFVMWLVSLPQLPALFRPCHTHTHTCVCDAFKNKTVVVFGLRHLPMTFRLILVNSSLVGFYISLFVFFFFCFCSSWAFSFWWFCRWCDSSLRKSPIHNRCWLLAYHLQLGVKC